MLERVGEPTPITEATVQELQLELLRRTRFNDLDGERVAKSLLADREFWEDAMFDRQPHWSVDYEALPASWLVKMRDMPRNIWNVDTLFILTDVERATQLQEAIAAENWGGDIYVDDKPEEVSKALGSWRRAPAPVLVSVWWD